MPFHAGESLDDCSRVWTFGVKDVTCYQDMRNRMLSCHLPDRVNRIKARFREGAAHFGFSPGKGLS